MRTVLKKKFNWKCSIGKKTINNLDDSWRENSKLRIYDALTMVSTIRVTTGHEPFYETISKLSHLPEKFTGQMDSPSGHKWKKRRVQSLPQVARWRRARVQLSEDWMGRLLLFVTACIMLSVIKTAAWFSSCPHDMTAILAGIRILNGIFIYYVFIFSGWRHTEYMYTKGLRFWVERWQQHQGADADKASKG